MTGTERAGVAVVGMSGRFPGAASVDELWRNLLDGKEAVRRFDDAELDAADVPEALRRHPSYVPAGADLADVDVFDAEFFGMPAHEARLTDPQHRIFLETCWRALEDAGHAPDRFDGRIGVFGATSLSTYLLTVVAAGEEVPADGISYPMLLGNDKDYLCTRVAHRLGLTGPAMTVQTACSSSLVTVHAAVESLLAHECDLALAGGVSVAVPQHTGYVYREGGIFSPDGRCRVFDAAAQGTVRGSGCGVVVLRRLDDAVDDRDRVLAVIRGSAVNNDGRDKAGFTAPSVAGQTEVIRDALGVSGVPAADIGYVETHGTGTAVGDPIEVRALTGALAADGPPPDGCHLGSIKANLGHLDVAAGVTGLIKTVLVLREQTVPVQVGFSTPNPMLADRLDGYRIATATGRPDAPIRAAAVSSFGLGGTNAHVVLTAAAPDDRPGPAPGVHRVELAARDRESLDEQVRALARYLDRTPERIDDVARTLATGRSRFPVRATWWVRSTDELRAALVEHPGGHTRPDPDRAGPDGPEPDGHGRRTALPGHPLRRTRHWVDGGPTPSPVAGAGTRVTTTPEPGALAEQVRLIVATALGEPDLDPDADLHDLGLDSMTAVELTTAIRDRTGLPLTFEAFDGLATVSAIVAHLTATPDGPAGGAAAHRHLLTRLRTGTAPGDVFLVPPAGGSIAAYAELSRTMSDERTLWALGHPVEHAARFPSIRALAELYADLVREVQPTGPYAIVGYSFGGSVAYEMALALERDGERVEHLVMLDSHPPEAYIGGDADAGDVLGAFGLLLGELFPGTAPPADPGGFADVDELVAHCDDGTWTPGVRAELAKFFEVWCADHGALKRWYPDVRVAADLTVVEAQASENPQILALMDMTGVEKARWAAHTTGRFSVLPAPGDHYSMIRNPDHAATLGAVVDTALAAAPSAR